MTALPVTAPAPCAIEACGDALSRAAARHRRWCIRAGARLYIRSPEMMRRLGLAVPDSWCAEHNMDDLGIRRALIRRLKIKVRSARRLRAKFPTTYSKDHEMLLLEAIGGELLARGRYVKQPAEMLE